MLSTAKKFDEKAKRNANKMVPPVNSKPPIYTKEDREADARRLAECICERKSTTIHCKSCGVFYFGRLARICPTHPKYFILCDIRRCDSLRCQGMEQLEELPIDHETYLKLVRNQK